MSDQDNMLRVIVNLKDKYFSIRADQILTMEVVSKVREIPQAPAYVRGIVELRGEVIPLVDLRMVLGLGSFVKDIAELKEMLLQREKDHKNWIAELESSVKENRPFTLATDPNLCAFGKWYNSFETTNIFLAEVLKDFRKPHDRIHGIAKRVEAFKADGKQAQALEVIEKTRDKELSKMISLFSEVQDILANKNNEIFIVIENPGQNFAITVDNIVAVDLVECVEDTDTSLFDFTNEKMRQIMDSIGRNKRFDELVINLNIKSLYDQLGLQKVI